MRKFFLYLFFVLLFSFSVLAVNPHIPSGSIGNLEIIQPQTSIFKINTDVELYYHIANSSGFVLNNTMVSCRAHVYNPIEQHILVYNLTNEELYNMDKELIINKSLLTNEGIYSINLWCNTSNSYGFLSDFFYITRDGIDTPLDYTLVIIVGLIGVVLIFLIISFNINDAQWLLKGILLFFSIFLTTLIPRFLYSLYPSELTSNLIKYDIRIIYLLFIYMIIYGLYKVFDYYGKFDGVKRWIEDNFKNKNKGE